MFKFKEYVLAVYQTRNFSRAAEMLYVSQPSLSMTIKRIEDKIGEPLFDRSVHPIQVTECGREYIRAAQAIAASEEDFLSYLDDYHNLKTGTLIIGGSNMNISFVLPPVLHRFREEFPHIKLEIVEGNINVLQQKLQYGEIDFVVDSCDMDPEQFTEFIYKPETLLVAVPQTFSCNDMLSEYRLMGDDILRDRHLLPTVKVLPLSLLGDIPFILLTPETDTYARSKLLCQNQDFSPKVAMSFNQQSTAFNMACAGLGATWVSDALIKNVHSNPKIYYYKVDLSIGTRHIKFFAKKGRRLTYAMNVLLTTAKGL